MNKICKDKLKIKSDEGYVFVLKSITMVDIYNKQEDTRHNGRIFLVINNKDWENFDVISSTNEFKNVYKLTWQIENNLASQTLLKNKNREKSQSSLAMSFRMQLKRGSKEKIKNVVDEFAKKNNGGKYSVVCHIGVIPV